MLAAVRMRWAPLAQNIGVVIDVGVASSLAYFEHLPAAYDGSGIIGMRVIEMLADFTPAFFP